MDFDREILKLYREMELEMIKSMKRNFRLHLAEEGKTGISFPQWQAKKIKALRQFQTQVLKIQNDMLMHIPEKISEHLQAELKEGAASEVRKYAGLLGQSSVSLMKDSFFDVDANKITSLINSLTNDLSKANTAVLRMMNDTYRQTIFKYEMFVANGVYTEKQAYDKAVKDFLDRGINCIEYKNGRRVNIADYTSMAIRTANQRAYMVGQGEFRKQLGRTLIIISRHNTSCELCKPFENKVLIDDVYSGGTVQDGDYMLLSEAMKKGLYHPRCRHGSSTYFPELEEIEREFENRETSEESKNSSDIAYAENQVQRFKRLTEGSLDKNDIKKYAKRKKAWQKQQALSNGKRMHTDSLVWQEKGAPISIAEYKDLRKYAESKGIELRRFKKSDVNVDLAKEFVDITSKMLKKFPDIREKNTGKFVLELTQNLTDSDFAVTYPKQTHIIYINEKILRNKSVLIRNYDQLAKENWFVKGTNYRSIIFHEFGHLVGEKYKIDGLKILQQIVSATKTETMEYVKKHLSEYAFSFIDGREIIAEMFSAYFSEKTDEYILTFIDECFKLIMR